MLSKAMSSSEMVPKGEFSENLVEKSSSSSPTDEVSSASSNDSTSVSTTSSASASCALGATISSEEESSKTSPSGADISSVISDVFTILSSSFPESAISSSLSEKKTS